MSTLFDIKNAAVNRLQTLVGSGLGEVIVDNYREHYLDRDIASYPAAIVLGASVEAAEMLTNNDNVRDVKLDVLVVMQGDDLSDGDVENLQEAILNVFDSSDKTFNLPDVLGVFPSVSQPELVVYADKRRVVFTVSLLVKMAYNL